MKTNITAVLSLLVKELDIPVTGQSIVDELEKHPDHESMLAISDMLNNWNIPNAPYELTFEEIVTAEVPVPFIVYLNYGFALVNHLDEQQVVVSNQNWNHHRLSTDEFKQLYRGTMMAVEKDETSGEANYADKRKKEILHNLRTPFVIAGAAAVFIASLLLSPSYTTAFNWSLLFLTLFKTAGLATAVLLLIQSIDTNNPLIQRLCGGDNKKNCNAILSSKAAKVNGWLNWSEVGFFYFAGTWLALLFNSGQSSVIQILALLNIVSLPYTFYSIYYQWRVAKQWCVFCCVVQALLWLEFFALLPYLLNGMQYPETTSIISLLACMAAPVLTWMFIKPFLLQAQQIRPLKDQMRRFKYNADLFHKVLSDGMKYALPADEDSIIIGNREAEHIITMVSNPYCQPCANAHESLDEWLSTRDDIKLQVVFSVQNNENDPKTTVASHLLSLQAGRNDISLKHALNDWYSQKQKNYDAWAKEHPVITQTANNEALEKQKEWCKLTEITGTPTIFINGRKLPQPYRTEDIKYFI